MTNSDDFTDDEWYLIEQGIKPLRFKSQEYTDLYNKILERGRQR